MESEGGSGGIAVSPNGEYVYVTSNDIEYNLVSVISTSNNSVIESISLGENYYMYGRAGCLALTPNGGYIYASNGGWSYSNSISVISLTSSSTCTITVSQGDHGTISPGTTVVDYGSGQEFTFTPATGYHLADVLVNGTSVMEAVEDGAYTVSDVTGATTLTASYAINTFLITVSQGDHGTISPSSATVAYGGTQAFTITPNAGYHIASLAVDGYPVTTRALYTFSFVQYSHSITACFEADILTATVTTTCDTFPLEFSGNITSQQMSNVTITPYQSTATTVVSFTVSGPSGTSGFGNITLPKTSIPYGTTPVVYIENVRVLNQGFTQDAENYYVWYTTHFSTHEVTIQFASAPSPTPTIAPTSSMGVDVPVIVAIILIGIVIFGLIVKRKSRPNPTSYPKR